MLRNAWSSSKGRTGGCSEEGWEGATQTLHKPSTPSFFPLLLSSLPVYYILFNNKKYIKDGVEGVEGVEGCVELDRQPLKKFLEKSFSCRLQLDLAHPSTLHTLHTQFR
jgi:hypothetical protein